MLRSVRLFSIVLTLGAIACAGEAQAAGRLAAFRAARVAAIEAAFQANDAAPEAYAAPAPAPEAAPPGGPSMAGPSGACCPAPCCPTPCIKYRHHGHHKVCCGCAPSYETVLCATNPKTCCPVNIPVCVPGCCTGAPSMTCHHHTVRYEWCCGYKVTVRFKHNGDVVVVSRG